MKNLAAPAAIGVVALMLALVFTRDMTSSFDSVRYANVAHWLAQGDGIATSLTVVPVQEGTPPVGDGLHAFTIQPPGLPLFYALTGVDNRVASHALLHGVSLLALGWFILGVGRQLSGQVAVGATAALLTILSPVVLLTTENLWTDLPTTTLLLGALYLLIRAREAKVRAWAWLLGASVLAGLAVSLRLTALAFGGVLLADLIQNRTLPGRRLLMRVITGFGPFGAVVLSVLLRNRLLTGSFSGTVPRDWPLAPDFSLPRGAAFLGSRLLQALVPGWATEPAAQKIGAANAEPGGWSLPLVLILLLLVCAAVIRGLRRRGKLNWSPPHESVPGARVLAASLFGAGVIVLLLPAARHADFRVVEFRYTAALLPLIWLAVATVSISTGRRALDLGLAGVLVLLFAAGVPGLHRPYTHSHQYMQQGLDWLRLTVPPEVPILSNGGKVLLDEDLSRRVYHLSDWNFRHALPPELGHGAGLLRYLRGRDIGYVVLFGQPDLHQAEYWGKPIIGLFLGRRWPSWLVYNDKYVKVYRIPADADPPHQP